MGSEHPVFTCGCALCHTWRRVGALFSRPDATPDFRLWSLRRVRELHTELLDAVEGFVLGGNPPVAVGGVPSQRGGNLESAPLQATPVQAPKAEGAETPVPEGVDTSQAPEVPVGPAEATSKASPAVPPPTLAPGGDQPLPANRPKPEGVEELKDAVSPATKKSKKKDKKEKARKKAKDKTPKQENPSESEAAISPPRLLPQLREKP